MAFVYYFDAIYESGKNHTTCIVRVSGESMVNPGRHDHEVVLVQLNPDPLVVLATDVEIATAVKNVADLFVFVDVLVEEHLDFCLVDVTHGGWRDGDLVAVFVAPLRSQTVHVFNGGAVEVHYAELR